MKFRNISPVITLLISTFLVSETAIASSEWKISEVFSSSDGKVQFVELFTDSTGQNNIEGLVLYSRSSTDNEWNAPERSLVFDKNLTGDTANKTILIATQHFTDRTGLVPDFFLPDDSLPLQGGTVQYGSFDVVTLVREQFPLNGTQSIDGNGAPQIATPTKFVGNSTGIGIAPVATVNLDAAILTLPEVEVPGFGIAYLNFDIDLQALKFTLREDYFFYGEGITLGGLPSRFQNGNSLYIPALFYDDQFYELRLDLVSGDPVIFANVDILDVYEGLPSINRDEAPNWIISEFFSNYDGSVQFVELFAYGTDEQNIAGVTLEAGIQFFNELTTFTFPDDLDGTTENKSILLATAGFEQSTGLAPDFVIPDGFIPINLSPNSFTLDFNNGKDRLRVTSNIMPVNGFQSANRIHGSQTATPTNFAGEIGTVEVDSVAVLDGDAATIFMPEVLRNGGDVQGQLFTVDLENLLLTMTTSWPLLFGITASDSAVTLTTGGGEFVYYVPKLLFENQLYEITFEWIDELNAWGNIQVLSVTPF